MRPAAAFWVRPVGSSRTRVSAASRLVPVGCAAHRGAARSPRRSSAAGSVPVPLTDGRTSSSAPRRRAPPGVPQPPAADRGPGEHRVLAAPLRRRPRGGAGRPQGLGELQAAGSERPGDRQQPGRGPAPGSAAGGGGWGRLCTAHRLGSGERGGLGGAAGRAELTAPPGGAPGPLAVRGAAGALRGRRARHRAPP